jgi:hypothetical protein
MATIDRVVLRIEADLKDVNQKLKRMENNVQNSTQKSAKAFKNLSNVAKLAIGSVLVVQMTRLATSMISLTSRAEEMQGKFDVVFGSFAQTVTDQLDEFGNAVGRSTESLQEMASSVQDTFVPLGFSRGEASKLSVALTKLAVDTGSFNNTLAPDVMAAFQSALVGNHETVRRFGIIIDETAIKQELLNMGIEGGVKSATAAQKVQARLNIITAGLGDAIGDAERTAGSFANTNERLKAEVAELAIALGGKLMGPLAKVLGVMADLVKASKDFLVQINFIEAKGGAERIRQLNEQIAEMEEEIARMTMVMDQSDETLKRYEGDASNLEQVFKNIGNDALPLMQAALAQTRRELEKLQGTTTDSNENNDKGTKLTEKQEEAYKKLNNIITDLDATTQLYKTGTGQLSESQIQAQLTAMKYKDEIKLLGAEMGGRLETELIAYTLELDRQKQAYKDAQTATEEYRKEQERLAKEINDKFIGVVDSLANTFESSFIDALSGTKSALDGFKDFSRQLVEEIIKTYLRLAVINPIINSIFGGQGTGFQMRPTVSGGDVADRFIDIGKKFIGGRAGGGTVQGRKPIMVGERGPEMFVPNTGGRIVPNGALGGSLRGGSPTIVNQSLNFATGIQNTVRAEVMNMMPMIQNATLQAVVDQKRRGGTFAQGMS